ncbi:MAG: NAD(P)-dependent alcohol dehydrogenase [Chloroflexi bacterium]|nr:NAD(P)-dependent alcohol dehydrogenase [Chloroflexota bacterium]
MKAAVYRSYGPPEVLKIEDVEKPDIGREGHEDRVLIKVHSASVNPFDNLHRKGYLPIRLSGGGFGRPNPDIQIMGIDVAGRVETVGKHVTGFKAGDSVFGHCLGSHAEYVLARENKLSLLPKNTGFQEAAAVPCAALTALQALRDVAQIRKDQKVLIYGASGGIGHFAVQLAKFYGTEVTAVCSTANLKWVKELGADHMIDHVRQDFNDLGRKYDIILDAVGKRTFFNSRGALLKTGVYITEHVLYPKYHPLQLLLASVTGDKRAKIHMSKTNAPDLEFLRDLVGDGTLRPVVEKCYPLDQIAQAHRHMDNGHTRGKIVIGVANGL